MGLLEKFQTNWKQQFSQLLPGNCKILLAVSGGVDSVILTNLIYKTGFDFVIAHCNFQLRGVESERDEAFVQSLQSDYEKKVLVKRFNTEQYAQENKISIQEAARELRYKWFEEIVHSPLSIDNSNAINQSTTQPINLIATAHHANDNIETLLINFFRGTGISGLHGILPKQGKIIRPLLFATKEEIIAYAKENNLKWTEDSSNALDKYTRNFFRLKLIPSLKEIFPNAEHSLLHNIERFKEAEQLYQQAVMLHLKKLLEHKDKEIHIPILKLQKSQPLDTIIWEVIKDFNFHTAQVSEVKKLFNSENASYIASASHRIIKNRHWLIIAPLQTEEAQNILIEATDKKIKFERGVLHVEQLSTSNLQLPTSNLIAMLDAKEINFPLLLRKWKQGDYFYPLGMQKKKKLSKFFIDIKLSKTDKEKVWVVEMNKKIIWVIGYRIDDRFKITPSAKNIMRLSLVNA